MLSSNIGDLVQASLLGRRTSDISGTLNRLAEEMASGQISDLRAGVGGDFSPLAGLERDLSLRSVLAQSNGAAARFAAAQQVSLEAIADRVKNDGPGFLTAASTSTRQSLDAAFKQAETTLSVTISVLNSRMEGRSVFAGMATGSDAIVDAKALLADLGTALSGATSATDAMALADTWFDTPGGDFETFAYTGSLTPRAPVDIGEGATETLVLTAANPALRETLKAVAVTALMGQGLFAGDRDIQSDLLAMTGERLLGAGGDLTALQADIGYREERIEAARVRGEAQRVTLEQARAAIVEIDPYETAMQLQQAEIQLQAIFQITARLSNLSLVSVLR